MSSTWTVFLQQLLVAGPVILVYCVGMGFCLVYWARAPRAVRFAFLGLLLLFIATIGSPIVFAVVVSNQSPQTVAVMLVTSLIFSVLRAVGTGLLIAAVFAGRQHVQARGFEIDQPPLDQPPLAELAAESSRSLP